MTKLCLLLSCALALLCSGCQPAAPTGDQAFTPLTEAIDSLLQAPAERPFSGVVLVQQGEEVVYFTGKGLGADLEPTEFTPETAFVIGSLSKQVTAALVLREAQRGNINLAWRIGAYLPRLAPGWKDTVTVHQLLNHTHGIVGREAPLAFPAGTEFAYSNLGYQLLAEILEATTDQPYAELVNDLFAALAMDHSAARPEEVSTLVPGYSRQETGKLQPDTTTFTGSYLPAAYLISSAGDLAKWNRALHQGGILDSQAYQQLITPTARQQHVLFGEVGYGYGVRISDEGGVLEIGHTGYVPGYVTLNLYYPESGLSLVVLENLDWKAERIAATFQPQLVLRELVRQRLPETLPH